jgi:hypothetical protein
VGGTAVRILLLAAIAFGIAAPLAHADTQYGGATLPANNRGSAMISFVRHDDGSVLARMSITYTCRKQSAPALIVRLKGTTDGQNIALSGTSRFGRRKLRLSLTGTLTPDAVSGTAKYGVPGCRTYSRPFALRAESAPVGALALPAPGTQLFGLTSQSAGGTRLSVMLRVTPQGRIYAAWQANLRCGDKTYDYPMTDLTPSRAIKADGTFGGSQTYTARYSDHTQRYRVRFTGRLLSDGATGTLRASMLYRDGKRRYPLCVSDNQTWTART